MNRFNNIQVTGGLGRLGPVISTHVCSVQIGEALESTLHHRIFCSSDPDAWIVKFLIWLVSSVRISDLSLQVTLVLLVEVFESVPIRPLGVRVNVHLHNTIPDPM